MTEQLFGPDGVYGPDIRARIEHRSSMDVFAARGGKPPRKPPAPQVTEIHAGDVIDGTAGSSPSATRSTCSRISSAWRSGSTRADGSICYTGDSGSSDSIVELAKGCDLLIHMNHYFSGTAAEPRRTARRAATIATTRSSRKRAGVKTLVLTHLLAQIDQPRIREQIVHEIQEVFEGKVIWGEDLMQLTVADARVTSIESR